MSGDKVGGGRAQANRQKRETRAGDFSRNGDGEVGGNLPKRKGGLIMREWGVKWVRVERLTEMFFKLA